MSMSVGASSNALSYLQSLLQQGHRPASAADTDPFRVLLQAYPAWVHPEQPTRPLRLPP